MVPAVVRTPWHSGRSAWMRAGVGQDTFEGTVGAVAYADQCTEDVE
jgi:hypothetical protein